MIYLRDFIAASLLLRRFQDIASHEHFREVADVFHAASVLNKRRRRQPGRGLVREVQPPAETICRLASRFFDFWPLRRPLLVPVQPIVGNCSSSCSCTRWNLCDRTGCDSFRLSSCQLRSGCRDACDARRLRALGCVLRLLRAFLRLLRSLPLAALAPITSRGGMG